MFNIHERHLKCDPATAALVIAGVGTVSNIQQQKKAAKASGRALAARRRISDIRAARERTKAVREARIRRAETEAGAKATGTADTSAAAGAVSSIQSQLGANLSFLDQVSTFSEQASIFQTQAVKAQGKAATAGAVAQVGFSVAGSERLQSIFKGP